MTMKSQQNLWDAAKAFLRGKFIMIKAFLKKHLKQLNLLPKRIRKKQTKPNISRRKEIIKITVDVNRDGGCFKN